MTLLGDKDLALGRKGIFSDCIRAVLMGSRDLGGVKVFSSERDLDAAGTTLSCGRERKRMERPLSGKRDPEGTEIGGVFSSEVDLDAAESAFCAPT